MSGRFDPRADDVCVHPIVVSALAFSDDWQYSFHHYLPMMALACGLTHIILRLPIRRGAIALALLLALPAAGAELSGIVTEVQDGDSLTLVNWDATYKIRLAPLRAHNM